jgi:phage baseplate assembly protein W
MANARSRDDFERVLGRDLRLQYALSGGLYEDGDLVQTYLPTPTRDLEVTEGFEGLVQGLVNRLKTRKGELADLGHPEYGSRHHELIGEPNVDRVRALIKLFVLQALRDEPRIERVLDCKVRAEHEPPRETVRIELRLKIIAETTPLNLVVPFALGGAP